MSFPRHRVDGASPIDWLEVPNARGPEDGPPALQLFLLRQGEHGALAPEHDALVRAVVTRIERERAEADASARRAILRVEP